MTGDGIDLDVYEGCRTWVEWRYRLEIVWRFMREEEHDISGV